MKKIIKKIIKKTIILLSVIAVVVVAIFIISFYKNPFESLYIYIGDDNSSVWVEGNPFCFRREISGTESYKFGLEWSPNKNHAAFYDNIKETSDLSREWALKIFNPRTFSVRTIFIGDYHTSHYRWLDDNIIRVYVSAGSGVRIYRNININIKKPFIAVEHLKPEYWVTQAWYEYDD